MKLRKSVLATLLALSMIATTGFSVVTQTACFEKGGTGTTEETTPVYYSVILEYNGGSLKAGETAINKYEAGKVTTLPILEKDNNTFLGWFDNPQFNGSAVTEIPATATGNKNYYAKWEPKQTTPEPQTYTVTLNLNGGQLKAGEKNVTSYTTGTAVTLPIPEKDNYTFKGWYEDNNDSGTAVTEIPATATGNKTYYAIWEPVSSTTSINVTAYGGYEEGAYLEFELLANSSVSDYSVSYKLSNSASTAFSANIDSELIRPLSGNKARVDILGLTKNGTYDIKLSGKGVSVTKESIKVGSYDRSGYAHWSKSGGVGSQVVGAYNNDGTVNSKATIVYVTETTKNTVTANGKTGLFNIIKSATSSKPVIIRILGTVGAPTWIYNSKLDYKDKIDPKTKKIPITAVVGLNDVVISNVKEDQRDLDQAEIVKKGYNKLTSDYGAIDGLTSKMLYKSSEWDSYWNMLDIEEASNVTIEGIGTDAKIDQWGFTFKKCNSIEVRNLTFENYPEDACSFEGSEAKTSADEFSYKRFWVHNCTFNEGKNNWDVTDEQDKHEGDGTTDFKKLSYVTVSYVHYYNNHKTGLVGGDDEHMTANLTFHHNYYDQCWSRLPLGRQANMHMYNNYYKAGKNTSYFTSARAKSFVFLENCYYDISAKNDANIIDTYKKSNYDDDNKKLGYVKLTNCSLNDGTVTDVNSTPQLSMSNFVIHKDHKWATEGDFKFIQILGRTGTITAISGNGACSFGQNFDTDANKFYYDSANSKSNVEKLHGRNAVPGIVMADAGVHKN